MKFGETGVKAVSKCYFEKAKRGVDRFTESHVVQVGHQHVQVVTSKGPVGFHTCMRYPGLKSPGKALGHFDSFCGLIAEQ